MEKCRQNVVKMICKLLNNSGNHVPLRTTRAAIISIAAFVIF